MRGLGGKAVGVAVAGALALGYIFYPPESSEIIFPDGKRFAFTIVDDTDLARREDLELVYGLLHRYGLRTTKTVWPLESNALDYQANHGDTLADPAYEAFILDLQAKGFEIALHGARGGSSFRADVLRGIDEYREKLGEYPRVHVNHSQNKDNLYWGEQRMTIAPYRWLYGLVRPGVFSGHDPGSDYFWGDIAQERIDYVRRFTFPQINLLNVNPAFPYHLSDKPHVNYWFPTSNGANVELFERLLSSANLDRLEHEGGVCLVYAHLGGGGFVQDGRVNPRFEDRIKELASRGGWFVPASEILDHLREQHTGVSELSFRERLRLETLFLISRVFVGID